MITSILAASTLFFASGTAEWQKCPIGCWKQPPLEYHLKHGSRTGTLGYIHDSGWGLQYSDYGTLRGYGDYVADQDYDSKCRKVIRAASVFRTSVNQHTTGLSIFYSKAFENQNAGVAVKGGLTGVYQRQWVNFDGYTTNSSIVKTDKKITPMFGLSFYLKHANFIGGFAADFIHRPRMVDSMAGGGTNDGPGLWTKTLFVGYQF